MSTLMSFILKTLEPCLNDSANVKLWLPRLLLRIKDSADKPLLPVYSENQDVGFLQGEPGAAVAEQFAETWSIMNQAWAKSDPDRPFPSLILSKVTLNGLQNLFIDQISEQPTVQGYDVRVVLQPNYYADPTQNVAMPVLSLKGRYKTDQSLSVSDTQEGAEIYKTMITCVGEFDAKFLDCLLVATVSMAVSGSGAQRSIKATLTDLEVKSAVEGEEPKILFENITLEGDLEQKDVLIMFIKAGINSEEGQTSLLAAVKDMTSTPANLASASTSFTEYFNTFTTELFCPVPAQGMPTDTVQQQGKTALDVYYFDRLRIALNAPGNRWYLPQLIHDSIDPALEPYTQDVISISDQTVAGLDYIDIVLRDLKVSGLSNASAPQSTCVLTSPAIAMTVLFGTLPEGSSGTPPGPPVKLNAAFSLVQDGFSPVTLIGTLHSSFSNGEIKLEMDVSGSDVNDLYMDITALSVSLGTGLTEFAIELEPRNETLEKLVARVLQLPEVQTQILEGIQSTIEGQRAALSENFSRLARINIISQLS